MDRDRIEQELVAHLEAELARGITFWTDEDWNRVAREYLAGAPAAAAARDLSPAPAATMRPAQPIAPPAARPTVPPPVPLSAKAPAPSPATAPAKLPAKAQPQYGQPPPAEGRDADWEAQLEALRCEAKACVKCVLHKERTKVVVDSGSARVPVVFVGEGPGADEDAQGEAFVGRAGQLLTKIIAAIALDRADVYICNVVKCRPPGNRTPLPEEADACGPYLKRQLEILKPRVICTLGLVAAQFLLGTKASIGSLRGRVFRYNGVPVLPTYHPAFLLRNPAMKRVVWEDVQLLRKILDEGPPAPAIEIAAAPVKREPPVSTQSGDLFA
jgi:uracil-DNA glycosylase family 4